MAKLRSISTSFWSDPWIEDLLPTEKLLFIYLITNERTNMLGIYESSIKKISFETGIDRANVDKALKGFERLGKVKYSQNYIIVKNYLKHQNFNTNMMKSAIDVYNNLPNELKIKGLEVDKSNPSECFERLSNAMGMVRKIEREYEVEDEIEIEDKNEIYSFDDFWNDYDKKKGKEEAVKAWKKLNNDEKIIIKNTVKQFKKHKPFKDYTHPLPATYLNKKRFNDEIEVELIENINKDPDLIQNGGRYYIHPQTGQKLLYT